MWKVYGLVMVVRVGLGAAAEADGGVVEVRGTAQFIVQHVGRMGGTAPTPEEVARLRKLNEQGAVPRPLSRKRFLVRPGSENRDVRPHAEFVTDASGAFTVALPPGTWCVIEEEKRHVGGSKTVAEPVDVACRTRQRARCDAVWKLDGRSAQQQPLLLTRRHGGDPRCWSGPHPPAVRPH